MIKITRLLPPSILRQKQTIWTQELCDQRQTYYANLAQYQAGHRENKPNFPKATKNRYAHPEIKEKLHFMFAAKCAYCESHVTAVSYHHVEHFRPQSIYPQLAYEWNNLLLACERCNSGYKKDKFPLLDGSYPQVNKTAPCSIDDTDANTLLNPCMDDPADYFRFAEQYIVPRAGNVRAEETIRVCGLNREDLSDFRHYFLGLIVPLATAFLLAHKHDRHPERQKYAATLKKATLSSAPYAAMIRAKLVALNIDYQNL